MVTYQVSASTDDGFAQSAAVQDITSAFLKIGDERTYAIPYQMSAMRFNNINIPRSATITSAYLKITSINTDYRGQIYGVIAAEASDNPADFSSRLIGNAALTAASVVWDYKTAWSPDTQYESGDISNVVQEVVDRFGFSSGNSVAIYYSTRALSGKARSFASYEYSPSSAAVLEVTYETYTISGHILTTEAAPLENVTVSAGADIESDITDASGYYELKVPLGWSGTLTPSKTDWGFSPVNQPYSNVSSDQVSEDYTAFQPVISGYVKDGSGAGIEGVSVSADNDGGSDTTDAMGYYEITVPYGWSGSVSANLLKWDITPDSYVYSNLTSNQVDQDFTAVYVGIIVKPDGTGDFATIQAAIDAAVNGDVVVLQPGTFTGDGNGDIDFLGKAITVRGATGDPNDVIIDCQGSQTNPHRGFKFVNGEDANSIIESLTIINGYGPAENIDSSFWSVGGAIYCNNSSPVISNCIITNNSAFINGGGICIVGNCNPTIKKSVIKNNVVNSSHGRGGGICNYGNSNPTINKCTIENNIASYCGGGIYNWDSKPRIINCTISGNTAENSKGGGIYEIQSESLIDNCVIKDNSSNNQFGDGGGIYTSYSASIINKCDIKNNVTTSDGGGIYCGDSTTTISNCVIRHNSSSEGGGIYNFRGEGALINCTIIDNTSGNYGGGIKSYIGSATILNCVIWGNTISQIYGTIYVTYSNIQGGASGIGNINSEPLFAEDGYHLTGSSPCIDAGDPNYIPDVNETDIDSDPRVVSRLDMGADELFDDEFPLIVISEYSFQFTAYGKSSGVQTQDLIIKNYGTGILNWNIDIPNDCNWLFISPQSGQVTDGNSIVTLSVEPNKAPEYGYNYCTLQVIDPNASNSPQAVEVRLNVYGPTLSISPSALNIYAEKNKTAEGAFAITNTGYDILDWTIEVPNDCNWLTSVNPASSSCGSNESIEVTVTVDANGLDADTTDDTHFWIHSPQLGSPKVSYIYLHVYEPNEIHVPFDYPTLQQAVDAAQVYGDTIIVHPGKYAGCDTKGKSLTITSLDPNNPSIVAATIIGSGIYGIIYKDATGFLELKGLSVIHDPEIYSSSYTGIVSHYGNTYIKNCTIKNWPEGGVNIWAFWDIGKAMIENCLISGNKVAGILTQFRARDLNINVNNCTITNTLPDIQGDMSGIRMDGYDNIKLNINNSILSNCKSPNDVEIAFNSIFSREMNYLEISNSCLPSGPNGIFIADHNYVNVSYGTRNVETDPCFVREGYLNDNNTPVDSNDDYWVDGDYHLKSQSGRWQWSKYIGLDPTGDGFINLSDFAAFANSWQKKGGFIPADLDRSGFVDLSDLKHLLNNYLADYPIGEWLLDDVTSPCIDAGDPTSDWTAELWPHGKRINMGAYGGTSQASMSNSTAGNIANLDNDANDVVDYNDLDILVKKWCYEEFLLAEDFNRDGVVNSVDYGIFANNWLAGTMP